MLLMLNLERLQLKYAQLKDEFFQRIRQNKNSKSENVEDRSRAEERNGGEGEVQTEIQQ